MRKSFIKKILFLLSACLLSATFSLSQVSAAGTTKELSAANFDSVVNSKSNVVLVTFSTEGCGSCTAFRNAGILGALASQLSSDNRISIARFEYDGKTKADLDKMTKLGVSETPTHIVYVNGKKTRTFENPSDPAKNKDTVVSQWKAALVGIAAQASASAPTQSNPTQTSADTNPCPNESVLLPGVCNVNNVSFEVYLKLILQKIIPYIIFLAMVMIVYSGVQYMLGGINAENTKKAKARIVGILVGIMFFIFIGFILRNLSGGLTIEEAPQSTTEQPN